MNDLEGSLLDYNLALAIKPNDAEILANRSITKKMMHDTIGAENDLLVILKNDPANYKALTNLINIKVSKGEFEYALTNYNKMIADHPGEPVLYNNRADVYLKMKEYDKAFKDVNKSIELGEKYDNAYVTRAEINIAIGERKKALKDLQKAVKLGNQTTHVFELIDECNRY
jgi:tetratricopeptide (TPR) repeat protein